MIKGILQDTKPVCYASDNWEYLTSNPNNILIFERREGVESARGSLNSYMKRNEITGWKAHREVRKIDSKLVYTICLQKVTH